MLIASPKHLLLGESDDPAAQGLLEHQLQNTVFPGQHLEFRETQREQNKTHQNQECESDGSQKKKKSGSRSANVRLWLVGVYLGKGGRRTGPSPAPALVTKAAAVGEKLQTQVQ